MTKKIAKRPGKKPVNIEKYFTDIKPMLSLGFSLHRACKLASVPYTTVIDYYHSDAKIRNKIDALRDNTNLHARARLARKATTGKYDHKATMDWLTNMDEDFKNKPTTQIAIAGNEMSVQFVGRDDD